MNRSTWASGSGYVPSVSMGFWCHYQERLGDPVALAGDCDLPFLHHLEQRAALSPEPG